MSAVAPAVVAIVAGMLCGFAALMLSQSATRWQVYTVVGLLVGVFTLVVQDRRRQLVSYFVVGLSLNVHYYITRPEDILYVGNSSPTYFSIPMVLFPAAALTVWTLVDTIGGKMRLRWGFPLTKYVVVVVATVTLSAMLSSVRRFGIYSLAEILQWVFIYLVTVNIVRTEEDLALIIRLLLATLAIQCAVFLVQTASGDSFTLTGQVVHYGSGELLVRATGTVGVTPSGYAIFVEPLVFLSFALWRTRQSAISRGWIGGLAALGSMTLILTLNRTSWVTLILGILLVEILCRRRGIARPLSGEVLFGAAGVIILLAVVVIPLILPRLGENHGDDWETRKTLMRIASRMIAANPIIGVGPGAYPFYVRNYVPSDAEGAWLWVVHNEYLLMWAERGLVGLVAWAVWMRAGFRQALLASRVQATEFQVFGIGCIAGLAGLLWEYTLGVYPPYSCYALLWFMFGLLVAGNGIYGEAHRVGQASAEILHGPSNLPGGAAPRWSVAN